ncbi:hypothetical protein ACWDXD_10590 [Streptomyces sp. NPDC003314]
MAYLFADHPGIAKPLSWLERVGLGAGADGGRLLFTVPPAELAWRGASLTARALAEAMKG